MVNAPARDSLLTSLKPPPVKSAQVQHPIEGGFHAACSGDFQWRKRRVEPDIAAGYERLGHLHVVVRYEDDGNVTGVASMPGDLLDQGLPTLIPGVGLSGDDDLQREASVEGTKASHIGKEQVRALVPCHAPCEAEYRGV